MAIATLHISEQVFMEIEIADTPMPPTPNFVHQVFVRDGFGVAVPTLELFLYDQKGTLTSDLALMEGKKIKITIAKNTGSKTLVRNFKVFGISALDSHTGHLLRVVCILDVPKYAAKTLSKAYKGSSNSAMQQIAAECGVQFDGHSTSDNMTWLRVCQTLNSFSEDIALHGYAGNTSCMARVLTSDNVLRYKDLFFQAKQTGKATIAHNSNVQSVEGKLLLAREVQPKSEGGIMSYWMNYGYSQFEHDLSGKPTASLEATAPISQGIPINTKVKSVVGQARMDYLGWDTGMAPTTASNVHQYYRKARYQNMRFYGLYSEAMSTLVEEYSELQPLDPVRLEYNIMQNSSFVSNHRFTGKYIVGNKTMAITNGARYYEILKLYRANVGNAVP